MFLIYYSWPHLKEIRTGSLLSTGEDRRKGRMNILLYFIPLLGVARPVLLELQLTQKPSNFDYPVIFSDADSKFHIVKQVMSKLSQYHPELRVYRVKDLPDRGKVLIENWNFRPEGDGRSGL